MDAIETKTKVVFRKFKGEIIALFPYEKWSDGLCSSYMHIGQHGGADLSHCLRASKAVKEEDYKDLLAELESVGYNLTIIKRVSKLSPTYL